MGLSSSGNGSLSIQDILTKRSSGNIEAAFLHLLCGQWALGLPVSGKLFAQGTYDLELNCLSYPRKILTTSWENLACSKHPFLVKTPIQLELNEDWKELASTANFHTYSLHTRQIFSMQETHLVYPVALFAQNVLTQN